VEKCLGPAPVTGNRILEWNNWTEVGDLSVAREYLGCWEQTAALAFGGEIPPSTAATEEWNVGPQTITFTDS
jgi:hypothetical protein